MRQISTNYTKVDLPMKIQQFFEALHVKPQATVQWISGGVESSFCISSFVSSLSVFAAHIIIYSHGHLFILMIVFIVLRGLINALQFARILASLISLSLTHSIFLREFECVVSSVRCGCFILCDTQRNSAVVNSFLCVNLNSVFTDILSVTFCVIFLFVCVFVVYFD